MQQINCKKTLSCFALATLPTLLVAIKVSADEYPGDLCCEFWEYNHFTGNSIKKCLDHDLLGDNGTLVSVLPNGFTNNVESWSCGKNVQYDFCYLVQDQCNGVTAESGAGTVKNAVLGTPNMIGKVMLTYYDAAERGAVTTFTGPDCSGWSGRFEAPHDRNGIAKYDVNELLTHGHMHNDSIRSIEIPPGLTVDLYQNEGFTGVMITLQGHWKDDHQAMSCHSLYWEGEDYGVSSITV